MNKYQDQSSIYENEALERTQLTSYRYNMAILKRKKILKEANVGKSKSVIEIGCGEGQIINHINAGLRLGVDISPTRIKQASRLADSLGIKTSFLVRDAQNLSLGNKKFDVVICSEVIEHIPYPNRLLDEIKGIMKKNSKLIITTPNLFSPRRLIAKAITGRAGDKTHLRIYTYKNLKELLEIHGYKIVKHVPLTIEYLFYNRIPLGKFFDSLDFQLRKKAAEIFPNLSDLIFLVVKKK